MVLINEGTEISSVVNNPNTEPVTEDIKDSTWVSPEEFKQSIPFYKRVANQVISFLEGKRASQVRTSTELFQNLSAEAKLNDERLSLEEYLQDSGEILPNDHIFTQMVIEVWEKISGLKEYKIYAVDTEDDGLAFHHGESKSIALGKGILTLLQKNGLKITEDHIAAIIAHEITHGERAVKEGDKDSKEKYVSYIRYKTAGHSQEHQADRQGMLMLARMGYNPRAMVDIIFHFNNLQLTSSGGSHPADLDRVII